MVYSEDVMRELWLNGKLNDNFVCLSNDRIVAHITFNPQSKRRNGSIYMTNLTVLPEYRRMGIAQSLIGEAVEYYTCNGFALPMSLHVDKSNIPALKLYQKVGYKIKDTICEFDSDKDQYIMEASPQKLKDKIKSIKSEKQDEN